MHVQMYNVHLYIVLYSVQVADDASPVYALNSTTVRILEFPVQGEQDVLEPYFWRDTECLPVIGLYKLKYHTYGVRINITIQKRQSIFSVSTPSRLYYIFLNLGSTIYASSRLLSNIF